MTLEVTEPQRWPRKRWWILIAFVSLTQLGLIFWLGRPQRIARPRHDFVPSLQFTGTNAARLLAYGDPTLFALPHQEGFSGLAWLTIPEQQFPAFAWSEPAPLLAMDPSRLGESFRTFMASNELGALPDVAQVELKLKTPSTAASSPLVTQTRLRLMGGLAGRRFVTAPQLPSWPSTEILSNSVIQLLVGADGKPISGTLLKPTGSASTEADQHALRESSRVRFEPVLGADPLDPMAAIKLGQLVFEWHTVPFAATNAAAPIAVPK